MTSLHYLHEPGIMYNLEVRSQVGNQVIPQRNRALTEHCEIKPACSVPCLPNPAQRPYTYVANVLVAVNPLRRVPDPPIESYRNTSVASNPPHPYGVAEVTCCPLHAKQLTNPAG